MTMRNLFLLPVALLLTVSSCSPARKLTKTDYSQYASTEMTHLRLKNDSVDAQRLLTLEWENPRIELIRFSGGDTVRITVQADRAELAEQTALKSVSASVDSISTQTSASETRDEERKSEPAPKLSILLMCILPIIVIVLSWRGIRSRR